MTAPKKIDPLKFPRTDEGAAQLLHALYGHEFRYLKGLGWLVWNGKWWKVHRSAGWVMPQLVKASRMLYDQTEKIKDPDLRLIWQKHARRLENLQPALHTINLTKRIPGVVVNLEGFKAWDIERLLE